MKYKQKLSRELKGLIPIPQVEIEFYHLLLSFSFFLSFFFQFLKPSFHLQLFFFSEMGVIFSRKKVIVDIDLLGIYGEGIDQCCEYCAMCIRWKATRCSHGYTQLLTNQNFNKPRHFKEESYKKEVTWEFPQGLTFAFILPTKNKNSCVFSCELIKVKVKTTKKGTPKRSSRILSYGKAGLNISQLLPPIDKLIHLEINGKSKNLFVVCEVHSYYAKN
eukprot:TRINITY_DN1202_c1_g4_i2.p1 TRINITY_DN1202_c1_g4~~TRINITY_DN1202_c1_g4_i2.p1  ORF type:complete len:218 (-),score=44.61 TRINITY_DN1202_c1_g4_i2:247-900(-)